MKILCVNDQRDLGRSFAALLGSLGLVSDQRSGNSMHVHASQLASANPYPPAQTTCSFGRASIFVNGEHDFSDEAGRHIGQSLLQELKCLPTPSKVDDRILGTKDRQRLEKHLIFIASFLRAALKVRYFAIPMNRHFWTGRPCGYQAAREITKALLSRGDIVLDARPRPGHRSAVYRCSPSFMRRLEGWSPLLHFKTLRPDCIEIRSPKVRQGWRVIHGKRLPFGKFNLEEVKRHRVRVRRVNEALSDHVLQDPSGTRLDTSLVRIFSSGLTKGGRLYAPEYQNLPELNRLDFLIDGEPVCEIDLKASHPSILAAIYRHPVPLPSDPYNAIPWVDTRERRKAAKTLVQCMVYADGGRLARFPRGEKGVTFKQKHGLSDCDKVGDLVEGILKVFPFLDGSPSLTMDLQFIEAEILLEALEELIHAGIPAYPVHDSLLVRRSDEDEAVRILKEKLRDYLGKHAPCLDVSTSVHQPRLIAPLPSSGDEECRVRELVKDLSLSVGREGQIDEEDDLVIDEEDDWNF